MSDERKKQIKRRVLLKLRCIRAFDNRPKKEYTPIKGAKYVPIMSEERKRQLIKRVLLKLRCVRVFDNRPYKE